MALPPFAGQWQLLPKPMVREAEFLSLKDSPDKKIEDYYDRLLGDWAAEEVFAALVAYEADQIKDLVSKRLLTEGQMIFFCLEYFRAEVLNGGFLQFLENVSFMLEDVLFSLHRLELSNLAADVGVAAQEISSHLEQRRWPSEDATEGASKAELQRVTDELRNLLQKSHSGKRLKRGFAMVWNEQANELQWQPDQYAVQLANRMIKYIDSHYSEFCSKP